MYFKSKNTEFFLSFKKSPEDYVDFLMRSCECDPLKILNRVKQMKRENSKSFIVDLLKNDSLDLMDKFILSTVLEKL